MWLLSRRSDCRIWMDKTSVDIVETLFSEHGIPAAASSPMHKQPLSREYSVQWNETDLDYLLKQHRISHLILIGLIATAGHYCIVRAYDHAEASLLAPLAYTEIVMATFAGWWFFGDFPDGWTFVGVAILIASAAYISVRERAKHLPPNPKAA